MTQSSAGAAGPAPVTIPCGTTILVSTTLAGDVGPCPGTAITVGNDGVTLDLGGHRVIGDGISEGPRGEPGIVVSGRWGVTIRNGEVAQFDSGVYVEQSTDITVTAINANHNIGAIRGDSIFGEGIQFFQVTDSRITASQVWRNGTFSGINLYDTSRTVVQGNTVFENNIVRTSADDGTPVAMQDIGIWIVFLELPTTGNVVRNNVVTRNGSDGIQISRAANGNTVERNSVSGNGFGQMPGLRSGDGIAVLGNVNRVAGNQAVRNAANGIRVVRSVNADTGLPNGGQTNTIQANTAFGNGTSSPSPAFDLADTNLSPPCDNNAWLANTEGTKNQPCVN
ncbi:MAG: right-handed parallel beta-helix repeat-containing protein [Actinomycetota bacterium]|nr:right-handed parallel beta-helix repeat-containing protein [Actinomycetota bacterium]